VASADPTNLSDGVFITHYPPGLIYTTDPTDWCATYGQYQITNCEQQNPQILTEQGAVWYLLAAWTDSDKVWCGAEFGIGSYDPNAFAWTGNNVCPNDIDYLKIPAGAWPGPGSGMTIAVGANGAPWSGNFRPLFWFAGYAYYPGLIPFGTNPNTGFGGFANCASPPASFPAICYGAMGLYIPGLPCCPPQPVPAVCCVGEECYLVFEPECQVMGGVFHPEWDTCVPENPCLNPQEPDVCCLGHECLFIFEQDCAAMGGMWHPEFDDCFNPNPCDMYTPVEPSSWGAIKAIYR
jgi:hypothetical protein